MHDAAEPGDGRPRRALGEAPALGMGQAMAWTFLGTLVPGLGLLRAGRRVAGAVTLAVTAVLLGVVIYAALNRQATLAVVADAAVLRAAVVAIALIGLAWVIVIGATHLALRPAGTTVGQRAAGAVVVGLMSFAVAAPLALGANIVHAAGNLVGTVFDNDTDHSQTVPTIANTVDPWAEKSRLNVLVIGGDSGTGRSAKVGMRADTVIVVSIDTRTGATTMFSLPRQTARMPFPHGSKLAGYFPHGWYDGANPVNPDYWLNAMYRFAPNRVPKDILGKTRYLSEDIMKVSVGEALGLDIDYFVTINMDGFKDVINALGGISVNVNSPIPIGGDTDANLLPTGWIEPGPTQHLKGRLALWYARGRWGYEDYSRMRRQRCTINAVVQQANLSNVLANFEKIAQAGEKTVTTDLPTTMVAPVITLAEKVQGSKLRSVVFQNGVGGFSTTNPNWAGVRKQVTKALKEARRSNATPSASAKATSKGRSDDVTGECGYHPDGFIPKGYPGTRDNPMGYRQGR
ncbi:LCP family protein [Propionicimonas sp.]|uniref:LCP family protein n=1 Tax=Propionicimonas sp. TaxID=1955623 RepID=UPI0039E5214C